MAREKGTFNFSANLEVKKQGPLDARQTMITYAELTQAATWQDTSGKIYLFNGLIVPVTNGSEKQVYMLTDAEHYNQTYAWKRIDGNGDEPTESKELYVVGDIVSLDEEAEPSTIKSILGSVNDFKDAITNKKLIVSQSESGVVTVIATDNGSSKIDLIVSLGLSIANFTVNYSGTEWTTVSVQAIVLATSETAVTSVTATSNKGIEVAGSKTAPTIGIKVDSTTKGNVDLTVGANGLKANFSQAPYFLGELSTLIESAGTNVSKNTINSILGGSYDNAVAAIMAKRPLFIKNGSDSYIAIIKSSYDTSNLILQLIADNRDELSGHLSVLKFTIPQPASGAADAPINMITSEEDNLAYSYGYGFSKTSDSISLRIDNTTKGNVDLSVGPNGLKANFTETTKGIKSGDKVLKVESDKSISATISLGYNSETKKLQLKGINDEVFAELDASAFIKDGMLNSATLEVNPSGQSAGTYLKLVFNTDAGKDPMYINVTSLIDVYTQGNGISVSGKTISIKLDPSTESYLSLSAAGLKLSGVDQAIASAIKEAFSWHEA